MGIGRVVVICFDVCGRISEEDNKELLKYLKSQRLMTLATSVNNKSWVCSVYYVIDSELNLYFVSPPESKHCQDILKNKAVACAIADSHTPNSAKKVGVQLTGIASQVRGWEKTKVLLKMWHKAAPGAEDVINTANMKNKVVSSRVYKVRPNLIKFFNQNLYSNPSSRVLTIS